MNARLLAETFADHIRFGGGYATNVEPQYKQHAGTQRPVPAAYEKRPILETTILIESHYRISQSDNAR